MIPIRPVVPPVPVEEKPRLWTRKYGRPFMDKEEFLANPAFKAMREPRAGTELAENRTLAAVMSTRYLADEEEKYPQMSKKMQKWVANYLTDPKKDIIAAARKAGYAESFCATQAIRQFKKNPNIQDLILKEETRVWNKLQITHERVAQEIANIAFSNLDNFLIDDPENPGKKIIDFSKASGQDIAAIGSYTEEETKKGKRVKITMHDKLSALQILGKTMGMFKERVEMDTVDGKPVLTITSIDSILFGGATITEIQARLEPRGFINGSMKDCKVED